jgi:hypothetical protein
MIKPHAPPPSAYEVIFTSVEELRDTIPSSI